MTGVVYCPSCKNRFVTMDSHGFWNCDTDSCGAFWVNKDGYDRAVLKMLEKGDFKGPPGPEPVTYTPEQLKGDLESLVQAAKREELVDMIRVLKWICQDSSTVSVRDVIGALEDRLED